MWKRSNVRSELSTPDCEMCFKMLQTVERLSIFAARSHLKASANKVLSNKLPSTNTLTLATLPVVFNHVRTVPLSIIFVSVAGKPKNSAATRDVGYKCYKYFIFSTNNSLRKH